VSFSNSPNFKARVLTPKSNQSHGGFTETAKEKQKIKKKAGLGKENPSRRAKSARQKHQTHTVATPSTSYAKALINAQPGENLEATAGTPDLQAVECRVRPNMSDPHSVATPSTSFLQALVGKQMNKQAGSSSKMSKQPSLNEQAARARHKKRRESSELEIKLQQRLKILREDGCEGVTPDSEQVYQSWDVQSDLKALGNANNVQNKALKYAGSSTPVPIQEGSVGQTPGTKQTLDVNNVIRHKPTWDVQRDLACTAVNVGSIVQTFSEHSTTVSPVLAVEAGCTAATTTQHNTASISIAATKIQSQVRIMVAKQAFFRAAVSREGASAESGVNSDGEGEDERDTEGRYVFDERLCQFVLSVGSTPSAVEHDTCAVDTETARDEEDDDIDYEQVWDECFYEVDRSFEAIDNLRVQETPLARPTETSAFAILPAASQSSSYLDLPILSYPWLWYFPSCVLVGDAEEDVSASLASSDMDDSAVSELDGETVTVMADNYFYRIDKLVAEHGDGLNTPTAPSVTWDCTPPPGHAYVANANTAPESGWEHSVKVVAVEATPTRRTPSPFRRLAECQVFSDDESEGESDSDGESEVA
jgi:hypothetical protein